MEESNEREREEGVVEKEEESCGRYLDLTSFQLHDLGEVEIPEGLVELDLTANRLSTLDPRIGLLSGLKKLSLRQNLFHDDGVEPISAWDSISGLQELVLRDNKLTKIPDVGIFKSLLVFDVSFNEISSMNGVSKVSNTLKELYVSKNEVSKIEEIEHLHALQILELGSNRLRASDGKLANIDKFTRAVARTKPHQGCELVWVKMYQKIKPSEQPSDIHGRV
ncbi:protein phosphatase 1 regulatory subunit pprA [Iris pallida]|uniref:Protein phosphatase 1 regulatory subunit pprA n=1 Tax=Iris pallida TaxID=29817 RepID=A0AAX6DQ56_IRIPA|nr:protein phosphatase 1 regulatory subunit pprA [Iris pallida]